MAKKKTTGGASLTLGIVSFILFPFLWQPLLGIFTAIPAIISGHVATLKIKKNPESYEGIGKAKGGLILGYMWFAVLAVVVAISMLGGSSIRVVEIHGNEGCYKVLKAEQMYKAEHGIFLDTKNAEALPNISLGDLQGRFFDHSGYVAKVVGDSLIITATANGANKTSGSITLTYTEAGGAVFSNSLHKR